MTPMTVRDRQHWSAAKPWHTNAALLLIGTGMLLLAHQLVSEYSHYTIGFSGVSGWSVILYAAAVWLILTQPVDRLTFPIILTVAIACRFVTLLPAPYLSSDIYRYVWDGLVQHAHISPYRYVPGDPALMFLRQPNQHVFDNINRRDYAHTIYPPAAQLLFYLITWVRPTVTFMKAAMVLFEGVTMYALVKLLHEFGFRREQSLLYAWCPLLIWEIAGSGHLDSAVIAFIALALLSRYRRQSIAAGIFLGLAILIKFYPLVLLPALFRRGEYKMPATIATLTAFGYACYSSVGMRVFGFLGGYAREEGMDSGKRYFLLELMQQIPGLHSLTNALYLTFAAVVFAGLILWCWKTCCNPRRSTAGDWQSSSFHLPADADFLVPAFALALALMLLFSPHYPWYIAWLIPFFALVPSLTAFTYICGLFYLCTTALAVGHGPPQFLLNKILYATVFIAFIIELVLRRWPIHGPIFTTVTSDPDKISILEAQRQS
jgi:alpha-1,6-mannosyltransferase